MYSSIFTYRTAGGIFYRRFANGVVVLPIDGEIFLHLGMYKCLIGVMFALLNVCKPVGKSSYDVVRHIKGIVGKKIKVGHAGTLDPLAEGVLIICLGKATRLVEFVQQHPKRYFTVARLGARSTTDDAEGEIEQVEVSSPPTTEHIKEVVNEFIGTIEQTPPAYSAVKVAGKRAYQLARAGEALDLCPKPVTIYNIEITEYEYPYLHLRLSCSSGTYVRSLVRDIGEKLSTGAYCERIVREAVGPFDIDSSVKLTDINPDTIEQYLIQPVEVIPPQCRIVITHGQACRLRRGLPIPLSTKLITQAVPWKTDFGDIFGAVGKEGNLLAIIKPDEKRERLFKPMKVFMK